MDTGRPVAGEEEVTDIKMKRRFNNDTAASRSCALGFTQADRGRGRLRSSDRAPGCPHEEAVMNHGFGHEVPTRHAQHAHRQVTRYLVVIGSPDGALARLFRADRTQAAEFDAGSEEVAELIKVAAASSGAAGPEWDRVLGGHTAAERAGATVYELPV